MRKPNVVEAYSQNGEVHVVIRDCKNDEQFKKLCAFNLVKIRAFMKKEATKPLLLLRAE